MRELNEDKCEYPDCSKPAEYMVYSRDLRAVVFCCTDHYNVVMSEGHPEYWDTCNNCGCSQGVN